MRSRIISNSVAFHLVSTLALIGELAKPYGAKGKLKAVVSKEEYEKLPEQLQDFYDEGEEGQYNLSTDDRALKAKVDEFRQNNLALKGQKDKLEATLKKFEGIDPERYQEAKEALEWLDQEEDAKLLKAGKFDEVVKKRTAKMEEGWNKEKARLEKELKERQEEAGNYKGKFTSLRLDTHFTDTIGGVAAVKKGAMADILRRAREAWEVDDEGNPVFRDKESRDAAGKEWTPETWAKSLVTDAPHFFESGAGGGSGGGSKTVTGAKGVKQLINPTPLELGKHAEAIAKGEMQVIRDGRKY